MNQPISTESILTPQHYKKIIVFSTPEDKLLAQPLC